jgi:enolase
VDQLEPSEEPALKITNVHAREILDSRGNPTVEVDVALDGGASGRAAVPSGASTGEREALELRDGDKARYAGKGVRTAVANVNGDIAKAVVGRSFTQRSLDDALRALDGTPTKSRLGANALLGVSMAAARAGAAESGLPLFRHFGTLYQNDAFTLPVPMMNILNGGAHADTSVDFQEFMVMPVGARSFGEAVRTGAEIFHALRGILKARGQSTGVGDEGGFAPNLKSNREAVEVVLEAVAKAGMNAGQDVFIALDVASSELWAGNGTYVFKKSREADRTSDQMVRLYEDWLREYPIISIEDGVAESDWDGWTTLTRELGDRVQLVGDDVFVTNPEILRRGIADGVANALLVKLKSARSPRRSTPSGWQPMRDTPPSSRTGPAKPRTRPSPTSRSAPGPGRSRPDRRAGAIASPNTISCCGSKKRLDRARSTRGATW